MKNCQFFAMPVIIGALLLWTPKVARADEYDDSQSHPLRVAAYLIHPVGVLLEWTIFRPLHYLASATPEAEYVSGHRPHPPLFADPQPLHDYGMPKKVPIEPQDPPAPMAAPEPAPERVKIVEVPVEKIVVKEVPKIVEVEKVVFSDVAFRFDSADLTDLGKGRVYLTAQKLKEKSDIMVVVEGHTDHIGTEEYNRRLGLKRAETVMNELVRLGIDPERISAASVGESSPLVDQQTEWARAVNRRVEFQVRAP